MAKLTQKELESIIAAGTERVLASKGLSDRINKIKFNTDNPGDMTKQEKTVAFFKALFAGDKARAKDISGAVADSGETLLPVDFINDIVDKVVRQPYALRKYVHVEPVQFRSGSVPTVEGGVQMVWRNSDAESTNNTTPKFGNIAYSVNALDGYTAIGTETMADTPVNIYAKLLDLYTDAFTKAENSAILTGSGSGQPIGLRVDTNISTKQIADTTNGVLNVKDILGVEFNIPSVYRSGAVWTMGTKALALIREMVDTQGRPLFVKGDISQGKPDTLCGYPILELDGIIPENLTAGTVTNTTEIIFGNYQGYYLFDRNEYTTELNTSSDTAFFKNQVIVKCTNRYDGKVAVPKSFVRITGIKVGA
jgi:HK97 family phage major capsid protein